MHVQIIPTMLNGTIQAISSKSYAQRLLIAAALADKPTTISINGLAEDTMAVVDALRAMGADIIIKDDNKLLLVHPMVLKKEAPHINCRESATAARLLLPVAAALYDSATISGTGSLLKRPFDTLCEAMEQNGCLFEQKSLPITFSGKLSAGEYLISAQQSSQFISGLMLSLPLLDGKSEIRLMSPLQSTGYVDMTMQTLKLFGVQGGYQTAGCQRYISPGGIEVEGDWSNAAFWLAVGVQVSGLNLQSLQKDRLFLQMKDQNKIDVADVPDLVPILAVCAAVRQGRTVLFNAARLRFKESNRLQSVCGMIDSLGGEAHLDGDSLLIDGRCGLRGGVVDSYNDHRIVMATAIASCFCRQPVLIKNAQAVNKSYPHFFQHFNQLGGRVVVV